LVAAWRRVNENGIHIVTVIGAAGVGKTRLVNAFLEWLELDSPGAEIWQGRAFEMGGRLSYQPVVEALRVRLEQENAPEDLLDDVWLAELSQLMPELRARYPDLPPPLSGEANFVRSRLFAAIAALGSTLAARQPAVFVLDDIQWADADTLDMIHYVAQHWTENGAPILLLLTLRQESFAAGAALREWLLRLGRDAPLTRLLLDSLSGKAVQQLVVRLADPATDEEATHAFAGWLWAETRGLPFFIEALLQMLIEEDVVAISQVSGRSAYDFASALTQVKSARRIPIPPGVREAILVRLERLSEAASALLLAAAVLGRECGFERLCQVAGVGELPALEAVELLLNGRLLTENSVAQRPYMLAHDYIREIVYSENREVRRRVYHRRALIALEADMAPATECAFHAVASRLDEPAFRFSLAAGDETLRDCVFQESLAHYDRARQFARRLDGTAAAIPPNAWRQLYEKRGRVLELANDYGAAQANYQEMLEMALDRQDQSLELAALIAQCIIHATAYSPLFNSPKARELGLAALALAQELNDREAEVKALRGLTSAELNAAGDKERALAYGEEALALARELGLTEQMGYMLGNLTLIYAGLERFEAARKASNEAQSIWTALGNPPMLADVYTSAMGIFFFTGEYNALLTWAQKALDLSQSIGNVWHQRMALLIIANVHAVQGQFGQALANMEAIMSLGEEINDVTGHSYCHCRIRIYLLSGELDRAEHWANKLYTFRKDVIPSFRALFLAEIARVKIALGKLPEGEAILEQAFDDFDNEGLFSYAAAPLFVADAYFQLALANPERALDRMHALAQRLADSGSQYYLAEALWLQGKACLALEKVEQASDALEEAVLAAEYTGERTVLWQVLAMLADLKTMSGNELEAKKLRERSLEIVSYIADHALRFWPSRRSHRF
jgi:tetratricopeptide (TPR) repeat protein